MLGIDLGISIILASIFLVIASFLFLKFLLPTVLFAVLIASVNHLVSQYAPELAEPPEGASGGGRPQEGLMGNPLVQKIGMMIIDKIGGASSPAGATTTYKPGLR